MTGLEEAEVRELRVEMLLTAERTADRVLREILSDGAAVCDSWLAQERLDKIRPLRETERRMMYAEHDVLEEARRISRSVGAINSTRRLDAALKRYDEGVEADRGGCLSCPKGTDMSEPNFASYSEAVDLANGFVGCWTHGGSLAEVAEWARQLRQELSEACPADPKEQT